MKSIRSLARSFKLVQRQHQIRQAFIAKQPSLSFKPFQAFGVKKVQVPSMGDSITEGSIYEMEKKEGDFVDIDEIIAVIETDKVKVDIRSPERGQITKFHAALGDTVEVGAPFFEIDTDAKGGAPAAAKTEAPKTQEAPQTQEAPKTVEKAVEKKVEKVEKVEKKVEEPVKSVGSRNEKREKMSRMRLKIAERLKDSQNNYALLTTFQEVDMSRAMELRKQLQDQFVKKHGVKLGFMSFFIKASAAALQEQPVVNAVIDGKEIVYRDYVDVSVAVATPNGLMVPVLRNVESQSFADIEKKGKQGKITMEEMAGGTFTISNGGVFGSMMGTPILNPPQSAILGMHNIVNRPVCVGDQILARPMMYLALTYDHRLIDGKEAATFLVKIRDVIQNPELLLFDI